jgi:hypothetical protein
MNGIRYVTDEKGRRVAVQIDLETHAELWEDIQDVLVAESRKNEPRVSLEEMEEELRRAGKLRE